MERSGRSGKSGRKIKKKTKGAPNRGEGTR